MSDDRDLGERLEQLRERFPAARFPLFARAVDDYEREVRAAGRSGARSRRVALVREWAAVVLVALVLGAYFLAVVVGAGWVLHRIVTGEW